MLVAESQKNGPQDPKGLSTFVCSSIKQLLVMTKIYTYNGWSLLTHHLNSVGTDYGKSLFLI